MTASQAAKEGAARNATGCHFLGSGFFGFWVLGIILNFPEPPFFGARISQNPREFHRTQKKPACLRKRRTQHDYVVLCRSRIRRSTRLRRFVADVASTDHDWRVEFRIKNNQFI
jgi:hypothetical protein